MCEEDSTGAVEGRLPQGPTAFNTEASQLCCIKLIIVGVQVLIERF